MIFFSLGNVDDYQFGWRGVAFCKSKMILGNVRCSKRVICRLALTSVLLHPLVVGSEPIFWRDWSRRQHRRACIQLVRQQCAAVEVGPPTSVSLPVKSMPLSRAQRAHYRLSWAERLACNARARAAGQILIRL